MSLTLTVVLSVLAIWGARAIRGSTAERRIVRTCGWAFLVLSTAWLAWGWLPQNWVLEESLPLHLSDVLRVVVAIALIWRPQWALAVIYYWGLTLNLQSIITADLNYYDYPTLEFGSCTGCCTSQCSSLLWYSSSGWVTAPRGADIGVDLGHHGRLGGCDLHRQHHSRHELRVPQRRPQCPRYRRPAAAMYLLWEAVLVGIPAPDHAAVDPSEKTATVTTNQQTGRQTAVAAPRGADLAEGFEITCGTLFRRVVDHVEGERNSSKGSILRRCRSVSIARLSAVPSMSWESRMTTMSTKSFSRLEGRPSYSAIVAQTLSAS